MISLTSPNSATASRSLCLLAAIRIAVRMSWYIMRGACASSIPAMSFGLWLRHVQGGGCTCWLLAFTLRTWLGTHFAGSCWQTLLACSFPSPSDLHWADRSSCHVGLISTILKTGCCLCCCSRWLRICSFMVKTCWFLGWDWLACFLFT